MSLRLGHAALRVQDLPRARAFYEGVLGLTVVWEPDAENLYLSSGSDNLALHQVPLDPPASSVGSPPEEKQAAQVLDHLGFLVERPEEVDEWAKKIEAAGVPILKAPRRHRDGSYSCYLTDPEGNVIQILYMPSVSQPPR